MSSVGQYLGIFSLFFLQEDRLCSQLWACGNRGRKEEAMAWLSSLPLQGLPDVEHQQPKQESSLPSAGVYRLPTPPHVSVLVITCPCRAKAVAFQRLRPHPPNPPKTRDL